MMQPLIPQVSPWRCQTGSSACGGCQGGWGHLETPAWYFRRADRGQGAVAGSAFSQVSPRKEVLRGFELASVDSRCRALALERQTGG